MSDSSARLALPFILPAQAQKHVTHNEAIERLDRLVQLTVEEFDASDPPGQPADGAIWALGSAPTGAWDGEGGRLATRTNGGWVFITPQPGWTAALGAELRIWNGTDWVAVVQAPTGTVPGLGINTSFDTTNRLAVASDATLLSHDGQGHQLKLNKQGVSDTASLLFQTDWSGRAEMGLTGSDTFEIKVSSDGTNWQMALQADPASGLVTVPNGALVDGTVTGSAVIQSGADTTPGRLLTTEAGPAQAFRRGNILGTVTQAGGIPTGAIIQRGSNANGEFLRLADGTQICWHSLDLGSITAAGSGTYADPYRTVTSGWTFPAAFSSVPKASVTPVFNVPGAPDRAIFGRVGANSTVGIIGISAFRACSVNSAIDIVADLIAIGRWF
jgi:hypothetical protein